MNSRGVLGTVGIALLGWGTAIAPGEAGAALSVGSPTTPPRLVWVIPDPGRSGSNRPAAVVALAREVRDLLPPCTPIRIAPGDDPGAPDAAALADRLAEQLAQAPEPACPGSVGPPWVRAAEGPRAGLWGLGLARGAHRVGLVRVAVQGPRVELAVGVQPVPPVRPSLPFAPVWPRGHLRVANPASPTVLASPLDAPLRALLSLPARPRSSGSLVARAAAPVDLGGPVAAVSAAIRGHLLVATDRELIDLAMGQDERGRPEALVLHRRPLPPRRGVGSPRPFGALTVGQPGPTQPFSGTVHAQIAGRVTAASTLAPDGTWGPWRPIAPPQDCPAPATDRGAVLERVRVPAGGCAVRVPPGDRLSTDPWPGVFFSRVRRVLGQAGAPPVVFEAATTGRGAVTARVDGEEVAVRGYGAALGMADLEGDGTAELLVSGPGHGAGEDRLHLLRLRPDGAFVAVWRSAPLAGRVWVASGGDIDGDGGDELVAIEDMPEPSGKARLWVVR